MNKEPTALPILPLSDCVEAIPEHISLKIGQAENGFGTEALSERLVINSDYLGPAPRRCPLRRS